jgi:hypothetical protein
MASPCQDDGCPKLNRMPLVAFTTRRMGLWIVVSRADEYRRARRCLEVAAASGRI